MSTARLVSLGIALAAGAAIPAASVYSQGDPPAASPRCVELRRIDRTEAVGDRDLLFVMKDKAIYRNRLPHACPGLARRDPFMYRVVLNQLCDTDVITMLQQWDFGFTPTESCLLGKFELIDDKAADELRAAMKAKGTRGSK
ncbi:MAG TPA: hypothetical protein VHH11_02530 [Gammaproteobacteria bacterium]|nr:hypothetical protein [Gammaproteobacteria bacterium]